jgi:chromosome segregation ATPase
MQQGGAMRDLERESNVLATQLAKAQAGAGQCEKLVGKFKEQQKQLVTSVRRDGEEWKALQERIRSLHAENSEDRKSFEEKLKRRDSKISDLDKRLRSVVGRPEFLSKTTHLARLESSSKATQDHVKMLQDRLDQADLRFEDEFARRLKGMQVEAKEGAREQTRELEEGVREMRRNGIGKKGGVRKDSGFTERGG